MEENRGKSRKQEKQKSRRMVFGILAVGVVILLAAGTAGWLHRQVREDREAAARVADLQREAARSARTGPGGETGPASEVDVPTGSAEEENSGPEDGAEKNAIVINSEPGSDREAQNDGSEGDTERLLSFAGDIYLSDHVLNAYRNAGGIGGILDEGLRNAIAASDLFLANEEFPFSDGGTQAQDKQFTFRLPTGDVHIMKEIGLSAVTLANNHVLDYGEAGLLDTLKTLREAGIPFTGAGANLKEAKNLLILDAGEKKIGVIAASRVFPEGGWAAGASHPGVFSAYDPAPVAEAIREARSRCDFLIVSVHWGLERHTEPEKYQRDNGHAYIDAGADLVIGSHPHVLQGIEFYQGKPIFYSMGNFIFGSSIPATMLGQVIFSPDGTVSYRVIPASSSHGFTQKKENAADFYESLRALSPGVMIGDDGSVSPQ